MAYLTTDTTVSAPSVAPRLRAWRDRVARAFDAYCDVRSRRGQIEALQALSDPELAALGMKRDDILAHVFRDKYFV